MINFFEIGLVRDEGVVAEEGVESSPGVTGFSPGSLHLNTL